MTPDRRLRLHDVQERMLGIHEDLLKILTEEREELASEAGSIDPIEDEGGDEAMQVKEGWCDSMETVGIDMGTVIDTMKTMF